MYDRYFDDFGDVITSLMDMYIDDLEQIRCSMSISEYTSCKSMMTEAENKILFTNNLIKSRYKGGKESDV